MIQQKKIVYFHDFYVLGSYQKVVNKASNLEQEMFEDLVEGQSNNQTKC